MTKQLNTQALDLLTSYWNQCKIEPKEQEPDSQHGEKVFDSMCKFFAKE